MCVKDLLCQQFVPDLTIMIGVYVIPGHAMRWNAAHCNAMQYECHNTEFGV